MITFSSVQVRFIPKLIPSRLPKNQTCGKNSVWGDYGINKLNAEKDLLDTVQKCVYSSSAIFFYGMYENLYREAFPFDCAILDRKFLHS